MWFCRALLVAGCSLVLVDLAWCQRPTNKDKTPPSKGTPKAGAGALTANPDSETLPADYAPPKEIDKSLEISTPIATPEDVAKLKKEFGKFQPVLNKALSDDASKEVIRNGIRYFLAQMCQADNHKTENLPKLYELRVKLRSALNNAGSAAAAAQQIKPDDLKKFRLFVMQEFVKQATPLLENNLYVRQQVVFLMGELELVQEGRGVSVEAFTPAFDPLVKTILDPKQPESVKLPAVMALTRILKIGTPPVNDRTRIAEAMIAELAKPGTHWWYQMRLAGALGAVALDQLKQPIVVTALKDVVSDPKRAWTVRAEAAKSLGRVPLPPASNPPSVVVAVADLALQLAKAAQKKPEDPQWKTAFSKVYLAFVPLDAKDTDALKGKAGLSNNVVVSGSARTAYAVIVPMVSTILKDQRLTAAQLSALEAWLKAAGGQGNPPPADPPKETTPQ